MERDKMNRGRAADRPRNIPARGWKDVFLRVKDNFTNDYLDVVSAGVGFYFFLALFPLFAAALSIYGLVVDPGDVENHINQLAGILPDQAHELVGEGMANLAAQSQQGLGLTLILSILISLWTANQGTKAIFDGINIAYNEKITRGFIKNNLLSLAITLGLIVVGFVSAIFVIGFPAFIEKLGLPGAAETAISLLRWPILFAIIIFSIGVIYKFAPDRDNPQFQWVSYGAAVATFLWILGSLLFSLYVNNFGDFDATYGSVAAVIILMLWFQLTGISVLFGAEINSELEHQTAKDTTVGKPEPMGSRNAYHADHVAGRSQHTKGEVTDDTDKKAAERLKDRERAKRNRNRRARARKPNHQDFRDQNDRNKDS